MPFTLRPLLFKLHLYLAVAIGVYVAILGITGAIMAFEAEIDLFAHANLAYVTPSPPRLSFAELGAAVSEAYPGRKINYYDMGEAPNLATRVYVSADTRTGDMRVYANPYTGQILGSGNAGVLGFIHSIHQRLTPSRAGRDDRAKAFVTWISVAALFLLVSGVWLWWPRKRFGIDAGGGRSFWYDLHATLGIAAVAFMVLLTTTGIIMGFGRTTGPMLYALTGSQPTPTPKIPPPPADTAQPIAVDRALVIAAEALPGAKPVSISVPNARGAYFVLVRPSGNSFYLGQVIIDQYTGVVLASETPATSPGGGRLAVLIAAIHRGDVLGIPSKVIMALASLIIALQTVSGAVMWIKRTPFRSMIPALVATAVVTAIAVYTVVVPGG